MIQSITISNWDKSIKNMVLVHETRKHNVGYQITVIKTTATGINARVMGLFDTFVVSISYKYNSNRFQCSDLFRKKYEGLYPKVEAFYNLSMRPYPYQLIIRELMDSDGDTLKLKKR